MPTTANFGLPYSATTDPPNGPLQIKALADAVDALLLTFQAATAAADVKASRIQPRQFYSAVASNFTVAGLADVPGMSVSFSTVNVNTIVLVTINASITSTGGNYAELRLTVNGVDRTERIKVAQAGLAGTPGSFTIPLTLAAAGAYVIKVRAINSGSGVVIEGTQSSISTLVLGP